MGAGMTTPDLAESKTASTSTRTGTASSPRKRENAKDKGLRLLTSGRLRVLKVDGRTIVAECRGDSGAVYSLGHDPTRAPHWRCICPATAACSHLHALWLVVAV